MPSRVSTRLTAISANWFHCPPARASSLLKTSSTLARPAGLRKPEPLKITSCIDSPRSSLALLSPSTQRTASMMLDLPQPFGPTTPTSWPGSWKCVGSAKDLKPESLIEFRRMGAGRRDGGSLRWRAQVLDLLEKTRHTPGLVAVWDDTIAPPARTALEPALPWPRSHPAPATAACEPATPPTAPSKELHVFPNPAPERDYVIEFQLPEFTCLCPLTGQPDFAHFAIEMVADKLCVELKSLKMYFWSYRNEGAFHEKVTNTIARRHRQGDRCRASCASTAKWYVRGGIYTNVVAEHRKPRAGSRSRASSCRAHTTASGLA